MCIDIRKRASVSDLEIQQSRKAYNPWADRRSSTMDDEFTDQLLFDIAYSQYGACACEFDERSDGRRIFVLMCVLVCLCNNLFY